MQRRGVGAWCCRAWRLAARCASFHEGRQNARRACVLSSVCRRAGWCGGVVVAVAEAEA